MKLENREEYFDRKIKEEKVFILKIFLFLLIYFFQKMKNKNDYSIYKINKKLKKNKDNIKHKNNIEIVNERINLLKNKKQILLEKIEEKKSNNDYYIIYIRDLKKINKKIKNNIKYKNFIEEKSIEHFKKIKNKLENNKNFILNKNIKYSNNINYYLIFYNEIINKNSSKIYDESNYIFDIKELTISIGSTKIIDNLTTKIEKNKITTIIGPSGCGKTTLLKVFNKMNDENKNLNISGKVIFDNKYDLYSKNNNYLKINTNFLRKKVGIIFQDSVPFDFSIFKNIAFGPKINGVKSNLKINSIVEKSLKDVYLWNEVKDNLKISANTLSGGQKQKLCIARVIANEPEVLIMDEPTSSLDPASVEKIENLLIDLKKKYTIIVVTHSIEQAKRISDNILFFEKNGKLLFDENKKNFFDKLDYNKIKKYYL